MRGLAIGDPYMPVTCFAAVLASLGEAVTVTPMQIDQIDGEPPRTESENRLREYAGDPAEVARAILAGQRPDSVVNPEVFDRVAPAGRGGAA